MAGAVDHVHVASELDKAGVAQRLLAKAWRTYIGNYCTVLKECGPKAVLHDAHTVAYLHRPDLYDTELLTLEVSVGGAANGHSLLDRRTLSASDDEIDDRTGAVGGRKRRCTVLMGGGRRGLQGGVSERRRASTSQRVPPHRQGGAPLRPRDAPAQGLNSPACLACL